MTYSVIIPIYNAERYLPACLDSVLAQDTPSEYEAILVDDGSTDGSGAICDEYAAGDRRIRVIRQENGGASAARNTGIRAASGQYILFLDADDLWEPGLLSALDSLAAGGPDLMAFSGRRFFQEPGDGPAIHQALLPAGESGRAWLERLFQNHSLPGSADWLYGYRQAFLYEHGLLFRPELRVSEDFDLIMRCLEHAKSIAGTDQILYHYRYLPGSLSNSVTPEKYLDDIRVKAAYFRKYPNAATANLYCGVAARVAVLGGREQERDAIAFIQKNRDIWRHASYRPYRLGRFLFRVLGCHNGSAVYRALEGLWHKYGKTGALAGRR